jgi:general secretion pathway protein A
MTALYLDYFGLAEAPFSIAPAPRYLYMSQRHQEALAHLLYGIQGDGGFVLLTGEVGTGKTTVCRSLLDRMPDDCEVAYIFNPRLSVEELLATLCHEFGIACPPGNTSNKVFIDCINAHLLDLHGRGRHAVLIIDEAQNLSAEVLEQMRLLTNLETSERKLLQIILLGQPELADLLARPELRQLAQRIIARYHLGPLTRPEVAAYVRHRLAVAGTERPLIPAGLFGRLYRLSGGIPRVINLLCDRALLGAYAQGKERVDRATLAQAAREVFGHSPVPAGLLWRGALAGVLVLTGTALAVAMYRPAAGPEAAPAAAQGWPAGAMPADSEQAARAALFQAWGADYRGGDPCREAKALGLRCRTARGSLDELRQLDRPALLRLRDDQGREVQATLTALSAAGARVVIAGQVRQLTAAALASRWTGHYSLLWRPPAAVPDTLRPGDRGPAVAWLRAQMAGLHGRQADAATEPVFDDALVGEVKAFQREHGLRADGCVGSQTLVRLLGATDHSGPKLSRVGG